MADSATDWQLDAIALIEAALCMLRTGEDSPIRVGDPEAVIRVIAGAAAFAISQAFPDDPDAMLAEWRAETLRQAYGAGEGGVR